MLYSFYLPYTNLIVSNLCRYESEVLVQSYNNFSEMLLEIPRKTFMMQALINKVAYDIFLIIFPIFQWTVTFQKTLFEIQLATKIRYTRDIFRDTSNIFSKVMEKFS